MKKPDNAIKLNVLSEYLLGRLISLCIQIILQFCAMLLYTHCLRQSNLTPVLHTLVTSKLYNCKYILSKLPSKIVWKFSYGRMQQLAYLWGWLIFLYIYSEKSVVTANSSEPYSPELLILRLIGLNPHYLTDLASLAFSFPSSSKHVLVSSHSKFH